MKTLLFFRHGKSDWEADFKHDFERPLAKRGKKAARRMGRLLARLGTPPDSVISSMAVRAADTLKRARKAGDWTAAERLSERLYQAGPDALLNEIRAEPDTTQRLMLLGHEPIWSETISRFIGGGEIRFPTAAVARIDLPVEHWRDVAFGEGELVWLIPPKLLG